MTDDQGRLSYAGFTRSDLALSGLREADPRVLVFKGGYEVKTYCRSLVPRNQASARRRASVDGKVLKLSKLKPSKTGPKLDVMEFHGAVYTALVGP